MPAVVQVRKGLGSCVFVLGIPTLIAGLILTIVSSTDDGDTGHKYPTSFPVAGPVLLAMAVLCFVTGVLLYNIALCKVLNVAGRCHWLFCKVLNVACLWLFRKVLNVAGSCLWLFRKVPNVARSCLWLFCRVLMWQVAVAGWKVLWHLSNCSRRYCGSCLVVLEGTVAPV